MRQLAFFPVAFCTNALISLFVYIHKDVDMNEGGSHITDYTIKMLAFYSIISFDLKLCRCRRCCCYCCCSREYVEFTSFFHLLLLKQNVRSIFFVPVFHSHLFHRIQIATCCQYNRYFQQNSAFYHKMVK